MYIQAMECQCKAGKDRQTFCNILYSCFNRRYGPAECSQRTHRDLFNIGLSD